MPGLLSSNSSSSSSSSAVFTKHQDIQAKYELHASEVLALQQHALEDLPDVMAEELRDEDIDEEEIKERCRVFLRDRATIFRTLRRNAYKASPALSMLHSTLQWRFRTDLDSLSLDSLHPLYVSPPKRLLRPPLMWLNNRFIDRLGRPIALVTLRSLERSDEGGLADVKEYIAASLEVIRRRIAELRSDDSVSQDPSSSSAASKANNPLQCSIIFDLSSSNSSNFELELLPFLLDLLKNYYPGIVSSVHVLNFGWVHSGIWALAKRLLPRKALEKVYFVSSGEIAAEGGLFEAQKLPEGLGGSWDVVLDAECDDVMPRLARPWVGRGNANKNGRKRSQSIRGEMGGSSAPVSPAQEEAPHLHLGPSRYGRGISRAGSFDSLADNYFSAAGTPRGSHSRAITPGASGRATPLEDTPTGHYWSTISGGLKMTADAAKKLRSLQMSRGGEDPSKRDRPTRDDGDATPTSSPSMKRSKSLRDFRLWDEETPTQTAAGDSLIYSPDADDAEEVDSDASGKVGETLTANRSLPASEVRDAITRYSTSSVGFFKRWAGRSRSRDASERQEGEGAAPPSYSSAPHRPIDPNEPPRFLSRRTRKFNKVPGTVSPYNSSNPFWGYPAYLVPSNSSGGVSGMEGLAFTPLRQPDHSSHDGHVVGDGTEGDDEEATAPTGSTVDEHRSRRPPHRTASYAISGLPARQRQMAVRRRWRDLVRTLVYLFALRLLSLNRHLKGQVSQAFRAIWSLLAWSIGKGGYDGFSEGGGGGGGGGGAELRDREGEEREWRKRTERHRKLRAAAAASGGGGRGRWSSTRSTSLAAAATSNPSTLSLRKREMAWMMIIFALTAMIASRRGGNARSITYLRKRSIAAAAAGR